MTERWKKIRGFPDYSVSNTGLVRSDKTGRILSLSENQYGVMNVGMMKNGIQCHRSVPLLVANAFMRRPNDAFNTPINLDGNRHNNSVENLEWRPRWFAAKYNRQFRDGFRYPIREKIKDIKTGEIYENTLDAAMKNGLLEAEIVFAILNHNYVWPTYQEFEIVD